MSLERYTHPAAVPAFTPRRPLSAAALLLSIFEAPDPSTATLEEITAWDAENRAADEALAEPDTL